MREHVPEQRGRLRPTKRGVTQKQAHTMAQKTRAARHCISPKRNLRRGMGKSGGLSHKVSQRQVGKQGRRQDASPRPSRDPAGGEAAGRHQGLTLAAPGGTPGLQLRICRGICGGL